MSTQGRLRESFDRRRATIAMKRDERLDPATRAAAVTAQEARARQTAQRLFETRFASRLEQAAERQQRAQMAGTTRRLPPARAGGRNRRR